MSSSDDLFRVINDLIEAEDADGDGVFGPPLGGLCRAAAHALAGVGAGISVIVDEKSPGVVAASSRLGAQVEELQFSLGEGPCLTAHARQRPVLVTDLAGSGLRLWPGYAPAALQQGVHAVFAFPLQVGAARLGVLDVYRDRPGVLEPPNLSLALGFADVALSVLLDSSADDGPHGLAARFDGVLGDRVEVYQAQGMIQMQLRVSPAAALARLRAHAFAHDRPLIDVARDVVARKLILEADR